MRNRKRRPLVGLTTLGWLSVALLIVLVAMIGFAASKGYY